MSSWTVQKTWSVGALWLLVALVIAAFVVVVTAQKIRGDTHKRELIVACVELGGAPLECREAMR